MNNFSELNLHANIAKAITACGYTQPTPVQAQSIPGILEGHDLVASAQTGTGKTAAFVLPALHRLAAEGASKKTRVLILTPTRELASQITKAASMYGKFLQFKIVSLVGGMPYHNQIKDLSRGADIIVATPGRLMDHMESKRVDLSGIEMLVLDEADRMLDMGFIEDVEYIAKLTPANRQTLLFSATMDNKLTSIVRHLLKNPVRIDLSSQTLSAPKIKQAAYKALSPQHKTKLLKHLLGDENIFKAIIFSATKVMADKLADQLCAEGFAAAPLHGDLRQNVRNRTIEQLRRGKIQYLVATDVAARGIDIGDVTHVINYDLPRFCEDYVHRIGRTGRAGKSGIAISFVLPSDNRHLQRIEKYIGQRIKINPNIDLANAPANDHSPEKLSLKQEWADDNDLGREEKRDRGFKQRRDDSPRSSRDGFKGRDDRQASRDGYKSRTGSSERKFSREDDRGERKFNRGDDRGERKFSRGDDRGERKFNRGDDRGERKFNREDNRGERKFNREDSRADRGGERKFNREDNRGEHRSDRDGDFKHRKDDRRSFSRDGERKFNRDGDFKHRKDDRRDRSKKDENHYENDRHVAKEPGFAKKKFASKDRFGADKQRTRKTTNDGHQPQRKRVVGKDRKDKEF